MKPKTARRFLRRNRWKIARDEMGTIEPPSFWRRVERAREALRIEEYQKREPCERFGLMMQGLF